MSPFRNAVIGNSFEEIVFTGRNKAYGAYYLRKRQKKYQIVAFLIAAFLISASAVTPLIRNYMREQNNFRNDGKFVTGVMDTTLRKLDPPEVPEVKLPAVTTEKFVPIQVVDTVDTEMPLATMDDILATVFPADPPVDIVPVKAEEDPVIVQEEKPFVKVEIDASFEGGNLKDFSRWVMKNIQYPELAVQNGIIGKVYVQFVINSKGNIENVTVVRGSDPSLDDEAVRVIKSSPRWSPPIQGGRPVKQIFTLPVVFRLQD